MRMPAGQRPADIPQKLSLSGSSVSGVRWRHQRLQVAQLDAQQGLGSEPPRTKDAGVDVAPDRLFRHAQVYRSLLDGQQDALDGLCGESASARRTDAGRTVAVVRNR